MNNLNEQIWDTSRKLTVQYKWNMNRLYKYRGNVDMDTEKGRELLDRDLGMIRESKVYFSKLNDLNDVHEGMYETKRFMKKLSWIGKFTAWLSGRKDHRERLAKVETAIKNSLDLARKSGIYSLCQRYDIPTMWGYYAREHRGYCIEYEFETLDSFGLRPEKGYLAKSFYDLQAVKYSSSPHDVDLGFRFSPKQMKEFLYYKGSEWRIEEESRITSICSGLYTYNPACHTSITFGERASEQLIAKVKGELKELDIKYYKIYKSVGYGLQRQQLQERS